ncbi:hypothetical protein JX266_011277 [Neoarthrinium moseri]|nr:hypothetical protein JX266_011277 [Neoarthrinium moseri]
MSSISLSRRPVVGPERSLFEELTYDGKVVKREPKDEEGPSHDHVAENPFDNKSSRTLFDAIDQLQTCGAGQDIDIPQLVIVGGQSTGKSSLLQSLVEIPFPTGQGCCTRFATRIVSRRTPPGSPNLCIVKIVKPDFDLNEFFNYGANDTYKSFEERCETLSAQRFSDIVEKVQKDYMGIDRGKHRGAKNFATEVLRVELSGPNRSHFSILDIPGFFSTAADVHPEEMAGVKRMVTEYMKKPQNLVICVADATNDVANQGIFDLAGEHVEKSRLIGVFTKCDRAKDSSQAREVVRTATKPDVADDYTSMKHGWFVVRNRKTEDGPDFDLEASEASLFSQDPWTNVPKSRRGSAMLKKFLAQFLSSRIRKEFPILQSKVQDLLQKNLQARKALGAPRPSHQDRVQYLNDVVHRFHSAAKLALEQPGHLPSQGMRVRNLVAMRNRKFDSYLRLNGHQFEFEDIFNPVLGDAGQPEDNSEEETASSQHEPPQFTFGVLPPTPSASPTPKSKAKKVKERPPQTVAQARKEVSPIRQKIREEIDVFQNAGLPGLLNTDVFPKLYNEQNRKWSKIALDHLRGVAQDTIAAAMEILKYVDEQCHLSSDAMEGLKSIVMDFYRTEFKEARKRLEDYMEQEKSFPLQTTNPRFQQSLEERRIKRYQDAFRRNIDDLRDWLHRGQHTASTIIDKVDLVLVDLHFDAATRMENEVHDVLQVYYELALETFIEFTTKRVIEDFVSNKKGPLRGLSTDYILGLSEAEVEKLAREDEATLLKRDGYNQQIARLERAHAIAENAWRQTTSCEGELLTA